MVSRTAPALWAFDKARAAGPVPTLDGMARVPGATPRRAIRAPVSPTGLRPVGTRVVRPRQRGTALAAMTCRAGPS